MPQVVKQFSFNAGLESWASNLGLATSLVMARDTTEDATNDPNAGTGTLQARRTGRSKADGSPNWEWTGTLEALGVPVGTTVTDIALSYDWRCSEYVTGANTSSSGPAELRNSGSSLLGTFAAALTFNASTAWATRTGGTVSGLALASSTTVKLRIGAKPDTGNSSSAAVTLRLDWVVVTVTYTTGSPQTVTAGTPVVNLAAPASTVVAQTIVAAGTPTITFTAPSASVGQNGPQTIAAGTPVVTVSAPSAAVVARRTLPAGTPLMTTTAPAAALVPGAARVPAGTPVVALSAPAASVYISGGAGAETWWCALSGLSAMSGGGDIESD